MAQVVHNAPRHHVFAECAVKLAKCVSFDVRAFSQHPIEIEKNCIEPDGLPSPEDFNVVAKAYLFQRRVAASSEALAFTHCSPSGEFSFFQKGALVLSQSIRK